MGHERIGFIPKTKQWQAILIQLQNYCGDKETVSKIATDTLDALKKIYSTLPYDPSIIASIRFLATLCSCSGSPDKFRDAGINIGSTINMYSLLRGADLYLSSESESLETNKLAKDSLMSAIITFQQNHETNQISFAGLEETNVWGEINSGSSFCELARSFVAEYTERNLNYYIERVAASEIDGYSNLVSFNRILKTQSQAIATHSKEISKLMQSFAAGWYNKNACQGIPDDAQITSFLSVTFRKIKEEFRREGSNE